MAFSKFFKHGRIYVLERRKFNGFFKILIAFAMIFALMTACEYGMDEFLERDNDVNARSAYLQSVAPPVDLSSVTAPYTVLVMSDIHFGAHSDHPDLPENKFWAWLSAQTDTPKFCLVLGDSAESGTEAQFKDFKRFADKLENVYNIPVYSVIGNHDLYNSGWEQYIKYCKPYSSYYHFTTKNFSWYALDSGSGTLGGNQMNNFIKRVKRDSNPKIVFTHYPVFGGGDAFYFSLSDPHERARLIDAFARNSVKLVLEGHDHKGHHHNFGDFKEYAVAAFRDEQSWHLVTINEDAGTASFQSFK